MELMDEARKTNQRRSAIGREYGFAAPEDCDPSQHIRTVMAAIECSLRIKDWGVVAEGLAMLEEALPRIACMEVLLKTTRLNAGGCATYETNLFDLMDELGLVESLGYMSADEQARYVADKEHWSWNEAYTAIHTD